MKQIIIFLLMLVALPAAGGIYTVESVPNVHTDNRTDYVSNPDDILSPQAVEAINARLENVRRTTTVEPAVVVVDNIDPEDPTLFATELFQKWGLGKTDKDNGLLILIVKDLRLATIRPGYGLEGVLPDITCGRIIRQIMGPAFRNGNYSEGTAAAVDFISKILLDPANTDQYMSTLPDADNNTADDNDGFAIYLICAAIVAIIMLLGLLIEVASLRGKDDYAKYQRLIGWRPVFLALTFMGLGIPAIASVPLVLMLNHWRNHTRKCPGCGAVMQKVDEVHDNDYLTPAQDLEEQVGSVDYDVWLCPACGETDILAYVNRNTPLIECENCHARTARMKVNRIIQRPTSSRKGKGVKQYECLNCHHTTNKYYDIPADNSDVVAGLAAAGVFLGSGRRGGGFGGGGGSFGGGFGGGSTGGGGATGGW